MPKIMMSYDPYLTATAMKVNDVPVRENSMLKTYFNQPLQKWVSELPELLAEEYGDDEFFLTFYGTQEDYQQLCVAILEADKANRLIFTSRLVFQEGAALTSDADAQFQLGEDYFNGDGVERDKEKALEWYHKAAEQGHIEAYYKLGKCYSSVYKKKTAIEWYHKAAEQGHAAAQYELACCYRNGETVEKHKGKAFELYLKAAEQGHAAAQYALSKCYSEGAGTKQNKEKTIEWLRKAAEQGYIAAQYALGNCYFYAYGVARNKEKAAEWFRKVCESSAENRLHMYAKWALERLEEQEYEDEQEYEEDYEYINIF